MHSKTILYFILNWGLGHATRSIPVIQALQQAGHRIVLVSTGRSLKLLQSEFPNTECVDLPDYSIRYSRFGWALIPHLLAQMPRIFYSLVKEHHATEKLVKKYKADLVVSDNRYGCYSKHIPSFFMTHQLRFQLPKGLGWSAFISEWFNWFYFRHYARILIPDAADEPNLSGDLSHRGRLSGHPKLCYVGGLTSIVPQVHLSEDIDLLVLISGPEPQRSQFEERILEQIHDVHGKRVIVAGRPEEAFSSYFSDDSDLEIHTHLDRKTMASVIQRAKVIVTRSGYSTLMELVPLKKRMILIPTPGQTEQEYLANHLKRHQFCLVDTQATFNINSLLSQVQSIKTRQLNNGSNQLDQILSIFMD